MDDKREREKKTSLKRSSGKETIWEVESGELKSKREKKKKNDHSLKDEIATFSR